MTLPRRHGEKEHGPHTLRVWSGTVVDVYGDDVFVELGPRMQGVISARAFAEPPQRGDVHEYTLRGREDSLWALSLAEAHSLAHWQDMEVGSLVSARAVRVYMDGLQLKIGPLHAYMPKSHLGLAKGHKASELVGRNLTCEVIEVESDRQRVIVSRKLVRRREREDRRGASGLLPGAIVTGRVTRIEDYGAFVKVQSGREGLIHRKDLAWDAFEHPTDVVQVGASVEVKVLYVREGGRRIGLGLKQMHESPWTMFEHAHARGDVVQGTVTQFAEYGAFVQVARGVIGLVHNREGGAGDRRLSEVLHAGDEISVRVLDIDVPAERLSLSLVHENGARIAREEAAGRLSLAELAAEVGAAPPGTTLGRLLQAALRRPTDGTIQPSQ